MRKLHPAIQSPRALLIFEAAARRGSFTLAAEELSVQQPTVSAAIKQLEETLATPLFTRSHRKITLTAAGKALYATLFDALNDIEATVQQISAEQRQTYVTLNSSSAFSFYWMMPKMAAFRADHAEIDIRLQTSLNDPDLDSEGIDLAIRLGHGNWPGYEAAKIADEIIYPVASPAHMLAAKNLRSIPNLMNERLIHLEEPIRERPTWAEWFAHHGIREPALGGGLRLNDYALVVQAAMNGEGIAFGWDHIVTGLVDNKLLVGRTEWSWRTGRGIFLLWSKSRPLSENAQKVRDWMLRAPHLQ